MNKLLSIIRIDLKMLSMDSIIKILNIGGTVLGEINYNSDNIFDPCLLDILLTNDFVKNKCLK